MKGQMAEAKRMELGNPPRSGAPGARHIRLHAEGARSPMDVPRPQAKRRVGKLVAAAVAVVGLAAATAYVATLGPALPTVQADTVWMDTVAHGEFVRDVRGPGTLVPVRRRWITALTAGRVDEILVEPGTEVTATTALYRLSNPDVEVQLLTVRQQLSDAEAELVTLASNVESNELAQKALIAQVRTQYLEAKHRDEMNRELNAKNPGLVAEFDLARGRELVAELDNRLGIETRRLDVLADSADEQLSAQRTQVERLRSIVRVNEERAAVLTARAGIDGVLAESGVEEGQWINAGETMGRVVQPGRLKAELHVPQNRAADLAIGQAARIDTRSGVVDGSVSRIDPAVRDGTITVDVSLSSELPPGARPNMSVDGTVVLERLNDVTYVGRPANARAHERVGLYRLDDNGEVARRVSVKLGRVSANQVEVLEGLRPGDRVVLSGLAALDEHDAVRIEQ